jgi:predicted SAM-dependent methyltransferase
MAYGSGLPRFFPTLTYQCTPRCEHLAASSDAAPIVLDLGAGGQRIAPNVTTIDMRPLPDTDVVASIYELPIRNESSDLVFATGLLEHLEDDLGFLREARRVLKTGGVIHLEVPFLQQYHEDPIDCRRCTVPGLKMLLEKNGF